MRRFILLFVALALLLPGSIAMAAGTADTPDLVVRVDKAYVGDGTSLDGGVRLLIKDGRIIGLVPDRGPLPGNCKVINRTGCTMIPGLVAAATDLVNSRTDRPLRPDFKAINGLDLNKYQEQLLKGGITAFHILPDRGRFIPGQGSVVKPALRDKLAKVLKASSDLTFVLGEAGKFSGSVYEPILFPDEINKLQPAQRRFPNSIPGQGLLFRALISSANNLPFFVKDGRDGFTTAALKAVVGGKLPVRFICDNNASARLAANLAWEHKLPLVIEDRRSGAGKAWDFTGPKPKAVIIRLPLRYSAKAIGSPDAMEAEERHDLTYAARLHEEGIPVVLTPASDQELPRLLLIAGTAIRNGLPPAVALQAITLEPARAMGLDHRIGSLRKGRDADFTLLSGAPFNARTAVSEVYVDGLCTWTRTAKKSVLAVKAGTVLRGDGKVFKPGVVIMEDGKITAAGQELPIPTGAKVIHYPKGVVTPGLIDGDSRLGLPSKVTTRPSYQFIGGQLLRTMRKIVSIASHGPEVDLSALINPEKPGFDSSIRHGVTSTVITSAGGKGRATLFNTTAKGDLDPLVEKTAALNCTLKSSASLLSSFKKALAYKQGFEKYDKAYKEWQGKRFGPLERPPTPFLKPKKKDDKKAGSAKQDEAKKTTKKKAGKASGKAPAGAAAITGNYKGSINLGGKVIKSTLRVLFRNNRLLVLLSGIRINPKSPPFVPLTGTYKDGKLELQAKTRSGKVVVTASATVAGNVIKGTLKILAGKGATGTFSYTKDTSAGVQRDKAQTPGDYILSLVDYDDDLEVEEFEVDPLLESAYYPHPLLPVPSLAILAAADPISGTWNGTVKLGPAQGGKFIAELKLAGTAVTGTFLPISKSGRKSPSMPFVGTYKAGTIKFSIRGAIKGEGTVSKDHMEGILSMGPMKGTFSADRKSSTGGKGKDPKKKKSGKHTSPAGEAPKPPKSVASMEPWLDVLAGKAALIIRASSAVELTKVIPLLKKTYKLERLVVVDSTAVRQCKPLLAKYKVAVLVDPDTGKTGPADYSRAGVPVIFGSGSGQGTSYMAYQAAYAVSQSMSPEAALKALTWWPGFYLGGGKTGGLERGRQADLVVWSGDPFDLAARVKEVIVQGKVVHTDEN